MSSLDLAQRALAPLALGLFAFFPPQAPPPEAKPAPGDATVANLSGRFTLNKAESEDAREKLRKAMEGRRGGPGPGMGPGPGGGGSRGGGFPGGPTRGSGGPPGPGGPGGGPEDFRALIDPPQAMTVTHTPGEIVVMEEDGRLRTLHPDGKAYKAEGGSVEVKTRWDGVRLLVETRSRRGSKISESWSLDAASGKLTITKSIEMPNQSPVTFRSVYDRDPGAES